MNERPNLPETVRGRSRLVRTAYVNRAGPGAMRGLKQALGQGPFAQIILFVSPALDFTATMAEAREVLGTDRIIACSTAGEITPLGYRDGGIAALALPESHFRVTPILVPDLGRIDQQGLVDGFIHSRHRLAAAHPDWPGEFAFTLIDGLSRREEALMQALAPGLGGMPLFGGSAGDGSEFARTWVACNGQVCSNAAVILVVRSKCPVRVFSMDHFIPSQRRLVITRASPEKREVQEINAEPAAVEYARLLGLQAEDLRLRVFASHPLVVRIGDRHHVRAIQRAEPDGTLGFASAIDEGLVMMLAEPSDITDHLRGHLSALADPVPPDVVLACDCLLRRIEIRDRGISGDVSRILAEHSVIGFNTYGEQIDAMHINHTMTGVAIYPPSAPGGTGA